MKRSLQLLTSALLAMGAVLPAAAQTTPQLSRDEVDRQPVPLTQAQVVWPDAAKRDSVEGRVVLKVLVGADGRVADVQREHVTTEQRGAALPAGNAYAEAFAEAAIASAHQWTFEPAMKNDQAVAVWMTLPMRFKLRRN